MEAATMPVRVERVGRRGEGVATTERGRVYVPFTLPREVARVDREGDHAVMLALLEASDDRVDPFCPYFGTCGGCSLQHWAASPYAEWKRGLLTEALARESVNAAVAPLVDAHGAGRRRATFHARLGEDGRAVVGFMQARSHDIVPIAACPVLAPGLDGALPAARAIAAALMEHRRAEAKPLDVLCTTTDTGLAVDLRGHGPLTEAERERLVAIATTHHLARLSNHGTVVLEAEPPALAIGNARVVLPPGAFLQATVAGEAQLAERVCAGLEGSKRVADLFSGIGTFALRLAERAEVQAVDTATAALAALDRAARATAGLRPVTTEARDLQRRPLDKRELARFDAVCLDPPRAGAEAQMRAIAASPVGRVVSVSCDVATFARDAAILTGAGFTVEWIVPVDQFRYSAHLEIVAAFRRAPPRRQRRLLG